MTKYILYVREIIFEVENMSIMDNKTTIIKENHEELYLYKQLTEIWNKIIINKSKIEIGQRRIKVTLIFKR